jgi:hypothetical protein
MTKLVVFISHIYLQKDRAFLIQVHHWDHDPATNLGFGFESV